MTRILLYSKGMKNLSHLHLFKNMIRNLWNDKGINIVSLNLGEVIRMSIHQPSKECRHKNEKSSMAKLNSYSTVLQKDDYILIEGRSLTKSEIDEIKECIESLLKVNLKTIQDIDDVGYELFNSYLTNNLAI